MIPIRTIAVLGAGALGSAYAATFFDMDPTCVSLIADGERYERLAREGLFVNGKYYAVPVITPDDLSPPSDLVLVAVKHHHLKEAGLLLKNRVGAQTTIISVMNGLDSEEYLGSLYGLDKVLYAISVGIDAVKEENRITYSTQGTLFFGEARNDEPSARVTRVREFFDRAGIIYHIPPDMIRMLWWKFMINVGVNQASAVLRAPYRVFQESPEAQAIMESAMREVIAIAKAAQVNLVDDDLKNWYPFLNQLSPEGKTSMLQDVDARRKTEVEMLAGKVVELGNAYGIPTPVNLMLLRLINVIETYQYMEGH